MSRHITFIKFKYNARTLTTSMVIHLRNGINLHYFNFLKNVSPYISLYPGKVLLFFSFVCLLHIISRLFLGKVHYALRI